MKITFKKQGKTLEYEGPMSFKKINKFFREQGENLKLQSHWPDALQNPRLLAQNERLRKSGWTLAHAE